MKIDTVNGVQVMDTQVMDTLTTLRQELSRLGERVAALEAVVTPPVHEEKRAAVPTGRETPAPPAETLSEEVIAVISAAIAAYLGKKPHIRQIRLLGTTTWAQQGRVTIEASHALTLRHARS
jgi:methylmalonyl-CoA carboxyltransferase large subunit